MPSVQIAGHDQMRQTSSFTTSTIVIVGLLTCLPLFLGGCNSSTNSLYRDDETDVVFDARLVGEWISKVESEEARIKIERIEDSRTYRISAPKHDLPNEWAELEARLVVIGGNRILDVTNPKFTRPARHYFVRIELAENKLHFQSFDYNLLRKNPYLLPHKVDRLYADASGIAVPLPLFLVDAGVTIEATTTQLQTFFDTHAKDESIWVNVDDLPPFERRQE